MSPYSLPVTFRPGTWGSGAGLIIAGAAMLTASATSKFGWSSIAVGAGLLLWSIRINGMHILQPWWRGRPSPFVVTAGVDRFDYVAGSTVAGIQWEAGFSHVYVRIKNGSGEPVHNVDVALAPEHPIIRSRARCDLAECRIAPLHGEPQATVVFEQPDGSRIAEECMVGEGGSYSIDPAHRLRCDLLPGDAEIHVNLATVVPEHSPTSAGFWKKPRVDPDGIRVLLTWTEDGLTFGAEQLIHFDAPSL